MRGDQPRTALPHPPVRPAHHPGAPGPRPGLSGWPRGRVPIRPRHGEHPSAAGCAQPDRREDRGTTTSATANGATPSWPFIYTAIVVFQIPAMVARFFVVALASALVLWIIHEPRFLAYMIAWIAALAPLAWSLLGLGSPTRAGGLHAMGARRPSERECAPIRDALACLYRAPGMCHGVAGVGARRVGRGAWAVGTSVVVARICVETGERRRARARARPPRPSRRAQHRRDQPPAAFDRSSSWAASWRAVSCGSSGSPRAGLSTSACASTPPTTTPPAWAAVTTSPTTSKRSSRLTSRPYRWLNQGQPPADRVPHRAPREARRYDQQGDLYDHRTPQHDTYTRRPRSRFGETPASASSRRAA